MREHEAMFKWPLADDKNDPDFIGASLDVDAAIDYETLKGEISKHGPFVISVPNQKIQGHLNITPCQCGDDKCSSDVISLEYLAGATNLTTTIEKPALLENESLASFLQDFVHNPFAYFSASAESQWLEKEVEAHLGFVPMDIYKGKIDLMSLTPSLSAVAISDSWRAHTLQSIFRTLYLKRLEINHFDRDDFVDEVWERFDDSESFIKFLNGIFDLGFLSGRSMSEYFIHTELEPVIEKGIAAKHAQAKRTKASGGKANEKRHLRIAQLLDALERLYQENPAFKRLEISSVADLAIADVTGHDPKLWSQGKGSKDAYIEEMRVDIRYADRFKALTKRA